MIRQSIWRYLTRNHPEGELLSGWLLIAKALLWPFRYINHRTLEDYGYDWYSGTWRIDGVTYTSSMLHRLATPGTKLEVVSLDNGVITVRELHEETA